MIFLIGMIIAIKVGCLEIITILRENYHFQMIFEIKV